MEFDQCDHEIRQIIIKAGIIIRALKGLSEEKNVTVLYNETAPLLGVKPKQLRSSDTRHLPTPEESVRKNPDSPLVRKCPVCGKKSYVLRGLCRSCKEAEGGKYKSHLKCFECQHEERSEKPMVQWLQELGIDFNMQSKKSLGIETVTDDGVK